MSASTGNGGQALIRDASYRAFDTTGYDQSCIDRILEEAGTIVVGLLDGLLDGCQP